MGEQIVLTHLKFRGDCLTCCIFLVNFFRIPHMKKYVCVKIPYIFFRNWTHMYERFHTSHAYWRCRTMGFQLTFFITPVFKFDSFPMPTFPLLLLLFLFLFQRGNGIWGVGVDTQTFRRLLSKRSILNGEMLLTKKKVEIFKGMSEWKFYFGGVRYATLHFTEVWDVFEKK